MRSEWLFVLGFLLIAAAQLAVESPVLKPYDEGLILYGASRVAHGALPYRDFWSMYGPGSFFSLAAFDRLFGDTLLVARVFDAAVRAADVMLVFALTKPRAGRAVALACAAAAFVLFIVIRGYLLPTMPAATLALLTMLALDRQLRRAPASRPAGWILPGALGGLAMLFRPDFGLSALLACCWALAAPGIGERRNAPPRVFASVAVLLAAAAAVALPLYASLLLGVTPADLYANLVGIPLKVYVNTRHLPFPDALTVLRNTLARVPGNRLLDLAVYVAPLVLVCGVALAAARRLSRSPIAQDEAHARRFFEANLVLLALLCIKGSVRVDVAQMLPASLSAIVVAGLAFPFPRLRSQRAWRLARVATAIVAALGAAVGVARAEQLARQGRPPAALLVSALQGCANADLARVGCFLIDPDRAAVLRYLQTHARPGDRLYVGAGRHDKLFVNSVELYFLSGLPSVTKWADLHPGVQTTAEIQRYMLTEMHARPPAFVVINTEWDDKQEPNASRESSGVTLIDDYLRRDYVAVLRAGTYSVLVPRSVAQP